MYKTKLEYCIGMLTKRKQKRKKKKSLCVPDAFLSPNKSMGQM